jgi:hypothetical protein
MTHMLIGLCCATLAVLQVTAAAGRFMASEDDDMKYEEFLEKLREQVW